MKKGIIFLVAIFIFFALYAQDEDEAEPVEAAESQNREESSSQKSEEEESLEELLERIEEIEEILDDVETATFSNRLNFGFDFRLTANNYMVSGKDIDDYDNAGVVNVRGRIKFNSWLLSKRMKLTGWLTAYKNFMRSVSHVENSYSPSDSIISGSAMPHSAVVNMERFYIDWFITKWVALTAGRAPTSDGYPYGEKYGTVSLGTFAYSTLNFPADGLYFTFNLNEIVGLRNSYLRVGYAPNNIMMETPNNLYMTNKSRGSYYMVQFDVEIPGTNSGKLMTHSLFTPKMKENDMDREITGPDGKPLMVELHFPDKDGSLGSVQIHNLTLGLPDILSTNIDFFASASISMFQAIDSNQTDGNGYVTVKAAQMEIDKMSILGTDVKGETKYGEQYYMLAIYNTPLKFLGGTFRIGTDFTYVTKNFFFYGIPDTTGHSRMLTKGITYDIFVQIPIDTKANITAGYLRYEIDHVYGQMFSKGKGIPETDETVQNFYLMLNAYF